MICNIEYFSETDCANGMNLHIEDDLKIGDEIYLTHKYTIRVENMFWSGDKLTVVEDNKILKIRRI